MIDGFCPKFWVFGGDLRRPFTAQLMQIASYFVLQVVGTPEHYLAEMNSFNLFALSGVGEQKRNFSACVCARTRTIGNTVISGR